MNHQRWTYSCAYLAENYFHFILCLLVSQSSELQKRSWVLLLRIMLRVNGFKCLCLRLSSHFCFTGAFFTFHLSQEADLFFCLAIVSSLWILLFSRLEQISQHSLTLQQVFWLPHKFQVGKKKNGVNAISDTCKDWCSQWGSQHCHDSTFSQHLFGWAKPKRHWPEKEEYSGSTLCNRGKWTRQACWWSENKAAPCWSVIIIFYIRDFHLDKDLDRGSVCFGDH